MSDQLELMPLEISDRELDRLLALAEEFCRRNIDEDFERRLRERYAFDRAISVQRATPDGVLSGELLAAQARDISLWGISLRVEGEFSRHDHLAVDLVVPSSGDVLRRARLLVEVRHAKVDTSGALILGCAFRESLDPDTMERAISRF
ncbi:MAG: PilZ domain-containing protein [Pirellulales bacterium]|nr:PilZ domain-containing protein [Pirellulales bacterium]